MFFIVGLGNPGAKYSENRHNIGFMAVDRMVRRHSFAPYKSQFNAEVSEGRLSGEKVIFIKPQTYMNRSGQSVGEAMRFYKADPKDVMVLHDELDLAPSKIKFKMGGGHAGHNGLRDIIAHIGNDFGRIRMGIGHPGHKDLVHSYVLNDFAKADGDWLDPLLDAMADQAEILVDDPTKFLTAVANQVNPNPKTPKPQSVEENE